MPFTLETTSEKAQSVPITFFNALFEKELLWTKKCFNKNPFFPSISTFRLQPVDTAEKFGQNSNLTGVDFGEDGGWQFFKVVLRYSSSADSR